MSQHQAIYFFLAHRRLTFSFLLKLRKESQCFNDDHTMINDATVLGRVAALLTGAFVLLLSNFFCIWKIIGEWNVALGLARFEHVLLLLYPLLSSRFLRKAVAKWNGLEVKVKVSVVAVA